MKKLLKENMKVQLFYFLKKNRSNINTNKETNLEYYYNIFNNSSSNTITK